MKKLFNLVSVLIVVAMLMAACKTATTEPTEVVVPTDVPVVVPTDKPVVAPTDVPPTEVVVPTDVPAPAGLTCAEPIKIGLITDASGALAIYGAHILRSFMLGMEYATGSEGSVGPVFTIADGQNNFKLDNCEFQVFVVDDQSNPETTATLARELIEVKGVDILVGTVSSGATATLQGIALENKIPLIVAPAAANDITGVNFNEYTFRTSRTNYQDAMNLCEYLPTQYENFIQIAPDYAFGYGSAAAFRDSCSLNGGNFVGDDIFAPATTTDFTPYMEQIADSGADSYIVTWAGSGFVAMMQSASDLGVNETMDLGSTFIDNALMAIFFGNAIGTTSGILYHYSAPTNPINDWLVAEDTARYGVPPDLFDADGMNAAIMVVEAIKAAGGDASAEVLLPIMEGMTFEGPKGTIYIRPEDHVAIQDMYILTLNNVTDPQFNFYDYVATTRPEPPCLLPETLKDRCGDLPYGSLTGE